ncbi:LysM peptidoglycan-binding domain-containing protein [Kitasatospora sp. NPDC056138]|uniref:LysM peptidoglycan-binding domain-containing protein n=1 Tax=Kitasatospora sp. NPDC056138 TaxID=3345724 RepID=UPI0035DF77B8
MAAPRARHHAHGTRTDSPAHGGAPGSPGPDRRRPVPLRPNRRGRSAGSLASALGALIALAGLLVGLPALLLYGTLAVLGMGDPSSGGFVAMLTGPDDGRLFLWALVAVGWIAWLCFALSVLLEVPAQLRGRIARRIPAFGWSQRIAAGLVGSVLAILPVAGGAFAATPEKAHAALAPAQLTARAPYAALPAAPVAPALAPAADRHPTYTVRDTRPADSLWSIAEHQLGSGERWVEIAKLNTGRTMDDSGARFDADRPIQPGWNLLMPGDAKADGPATGTSAGTPPGSGAGSTTTPAGGQHANVTVHAGDTLSAIAERELGSAEDWPRLFEANKGVSTPDGERLTDPDVLAPGMVLAIPGVQPPAPAPDPAPATPAPGTPGTTQSAPTPSTPGSGPTPTPGPTTGHGPAVPPSSAGPSAPSEHRSPTAEPSSATKAAVPSDDYSVALATSTVGVLLAAVLIGTVGRRRGDQQRARRPRHRIALPAGPAADFEAELKVRQSDTGLDLLNRALRTMARNTVRTGKRLPALVAVRVTAGRTVELHLAGPCAPIAPFRAAHAPNVWWCPEDSPELLSTTQAAKTSAPYPALVTLGTAPDGAVVLADLETVRLMHLSGHPDDARDVLRTLAVELAHSPLADRLHLHLVGLAEDLPLTGPAVERVHRYDTLEAAIAALGPRTAKARATLVAAEAASPRDARSRGHADESWVPEIVLSAQPPGGSLPAELGRLLDGTPRTCLAVVTRAPERGTGPVARWTLPSSGTATIPGLHLTVELQKLGPEQYDHIGELLRVACDNTQHPAPDWTLDGPGGDFDAEEIPLPPVPVLATVGASFGATLALPVDLAGAQLVTRVIGTGASPFAGTDPTVTPAPRPAGASAAAPGAGAPGAAGAAVAEPGAAGAATAPEAREDGRAAPAVPLRPSARHSANGIGLHSNGSVPGSPPLPAGAAGAAGAGGSTVPAAPAVRPVRPAIPPVPPMRPVSPVRPGSDLPSAPDAEPVPPASPAAPAAPPEPVPMHDPAPPADAFGGPADQARPAPVTPVHPVAPAYPVPSASGSTRSDSDDLLAILRSPEAHAARTAPRIRLLGPVDVLGAAGPAEPSAVSRLTELAALLALRPGVEHGALDRALHPGAAHLAAEHPGSESHGSGAAADRPGTPLPAKLAELATWFGSSADGRAFLHPDAPDGYAFAPAVTCDWDEFRSLYRRGMRSTSSTADAALAHALALVRGAPFAEAPTTAYAWAEAERQDMLAAIVDTAHELAARRLQYGDHRSAEAAIFRGLAVAPDIELLHRDLFYTYASAGARDQLVRAVNRLDALSRRTGRDLDADTVALLRDLLAGS